jgi:oxygen-independent coproporphyrinogen-3 oxidase
MKEYAGASSPREVTHVGPEAAFEEALFLGLRLDEGVCVHKLRAAFDAERVAAASVIAGELAAEGMMVVEDGRWSLTLRGRLVSNDVFGRLLEAELVA